MNRRQFLAMAGATAAPMILPQGVLGQPGRPGANDRLVTAHIGLGRRGSRLLAANPHQVAALCEVDLHRLEQAAATRPASVEIFQDYRALLDRRDIDAVLIATPNHWHAMQAIHAIEAGKDVFTCSPVLHTLHEIPLLRETVRRYDAVLMSDTMADNADANALHTLPGAVNHAEAWAPQAPEGGALEKDGPAPRHVDWRLWLGPAASRPYNPDLLDGGFRWVKGYGSGYLGCEGVAAFAQYFAHLAAGNAVASINTVKATIENYRSNNPGLYDYPRDVEMQFRFNDQALTLNWRQGPNNHAPNNHAPFRSGLRLEHGGEARYFACQEGQMLAVQNPESYATPSDRARHEAERNRDHRMLARFGVAVQERAYERSALTHAVHAATLCALTNLIAQGPMDAHTQSVTWDFNRHQFSGDGWNERHMGRWAPLPRRLEDVDLW